MESHQLDSNHFLSLPRPDTLTGPPVGVPDTTTLAAHDFDVDQRTGFVPPQPPLSRLPAQWEAWEITLDDAMTRKLKLGDTVGLSEQEKAKSESWRAHVRTLDVIPINDLKDSELTLRRAHHVLAWILHFYVHSLPPDAPIIIPPPITLPLHLVSSQLQLPLVLTYSDNVLYNWRLKATSTPTHPESALPGQDNLACQSLFTGTSDEEEFYLTSTRIELKGVEALELMQDIMDEAFIGDDIAIRRITSYVRSISTVIHQLRALLLAVRESCDPEVFYHQIRPWFRGEVDSGSRKKWVFDGIEGERQPVELLGSSAGQSSLIHALDIFLGVDQYSPSSSSSSSTSSGLATEETGTKLGFLERMELYMPRHHRTFLHHLSANPRPLRGIVEGSGDAGLLEAYNAAVMALKAFRDAHIVVVALYIVGPSNREYLGKKVEEEEEGKKVLKGTGGTELVKFLKDVRDRTVGALLKSTVDL